MTTKNQKEKELLYASQLAFELGVDWKFCFPDNELVWPDLIVEEGSLKFGLEIREIAKDEETRKGSILRAKESYNAKIVRSIADSFYKKSNRSINVHFVGELGSVTEIVNSLVIFSDQLDIWESKRVELARGSIAHVTRVPDVLGCYENWIFVDDRVGWSKDIDNEYLMPFVRNKEKNLERYRTNLADVRLLLVANPFYGSGMVSMKNNEEEVQTSFNKVYLLVYPNGVHCLES